MNSRYKTMTLGSLPVNSCEDALSLQKRAGVDIVTCGLPCGGFVDVYARKIKGIRKIEERYYLDSGALRHEPICSECLARIKNKVDNPLKAIIPGPATFLSVVRCDNLKSALAGLTEVLITEVREIERRGVEFLQINEPILSKIYPVPRPFIRAINRIANSVRVPTILHVCGDLSSFAHYIPSIDVEMISLEFAGLPKNFDVLTPDLFEGKKVVLGCVSTNPEVENREAIMRVVERGVDLFPGDVVLSSDCGFAKTPREVVIRKTDKMVEVAKISLL